MLTSRALKRADVPMALATGALVLENIAEGAFDEAALFHLLNFAREDRAYLLIIARNSPAAWQLALPDLASRLRAIPVAALEAPDAVLFRAVLIKLFADRQLTIEESLVSFLTNRIERSFAAARDQFTGAGAAAVTDEESRVGAGRTACARELAATRHDLLPAAPALWDVDASG